MYLQTKLSESADKISYKDEKTEFITEIVL